MNTQIRVYHTHVELSPYKKGDWEELEKYFSTYVKRPYGSYYKPFCYFIENDVLYLPKGVNILSLENGLKVHATFERKHDPAFSMKYKYEVTSPPKNEIQEDAVNFLSSDGDFKDTRGYSQFVLRLPTGDGKTYCSISSMVRIGLRSLVILSKDILVSQWVNQIAKHTTVPDDRVVIVKGSTTMEKIISGELEGDIYIVMHQTISAASRIHGWEFVREFFCKSGIGVKYIDESHEYLAATVKLDCFTNVMKNIYISGTFSRSRYKEKKIMESVFSSAVYFGTGDAKLDECQKHIEYYQVKYRSRIPQEYVIAMRENYWFSPKKFIDFSITVDPAHSLEQSLQYILDLQMEKPGQILIVSASIHSVKYIYSKMVSLHGSKKTVGLIHGEVLSNDKAANMTKDIICSTIASCGSGFNPPRLQTIICLEPHMSSIRTKQLKGRLDRYIPGEPTYFFDFIDVNIPFFDEMSKTHEKIMINYAKKLDTIQLY